jgi:hypothetical protein
MEKICSIYSKDGIRLLDIDDEEIAKEIAEYEGGYYIGGEEDDD